MKLPPPTLPSPFPEGGIYDKGEGLGGGEKWDFLYYQDKLSGFRIYFRLILHPIPFRFGVPNSFPSFSAEVRILKFDFSHS